MTKMINDVRLRTCQICKTVKDKVGAICRRKRKEGITELLLPRQVILFKILKNKSSSFSRLWQLEPVFVKTGRLGERVATCCAQHSLAPCAVRVVLFLFIFLFLKSEKFILSFDSYPSPWNIEKGFNLHFSEMPKMRNLLQRVLNIFNFKLLLFLLLFILIIIILLIILSENNKLKWVPKLDMQLYARAIWIGWYCFSIFYRIFNIELLELIFW